MSEIFIRKYQKGEPEIKDKTREGLHERQLRENKAYQKSEKAVRKASTWKYDTVKMWSCPRENWQCVFGYSYKVNGKHYDDKWHEVQKVNGKWVRVK